MKISSFNQLVALPILIFAVCGCASNEINREVTKFAPILPANINSETDEVQFERPVDDALMPVQVGYIDSEQDNGLTVADEDDAGESPYATSGENVQYFPLSLEEAIRHGLQHSKVIRELGGNVLALPESLITVYDPAIVFSDPQFGEEGALSEFDAQLSSAVFFEKNDRLVNNQFLGTNGLLQQDLGAMSLNLSKRSATGSLFTLRSFTDYDFNNSIGNRFGNPSSSWSTAVEGELRQPLLRGSQVLFNRIAGPDAEPGIYNGVMIARTRTDISVAEFNEAVRDFVSNIENSYWDLYYSYRDLEAKKMARDNALKSWRRIKALGNEKKVGGEADKEGQAREQYFRFEAEVYDSLYGRILETTRTNNGSSGGTFRPTGGVKTSERRLRLLIGLPINGADLIRPNEEPDTMPVTFDWDNCAREAMANRIELFRQGRRVRKVELEMMAAKRSILPQLDFVGRYRFRGFGKDLTGSANLPAGPASAFDNLTDGDHQEWQMGMELSIPIGYRREYAALRNVQHRLSRQMQILREQKRQILADLSNAIQNVERAQLYYNLQYNRLNGALAQLAAVEETNKEKKAPLNLVLEAQRRVLDAQTQFYRAKVEYALAVRNVHFEKGSLLDYANVRFQAENMESGAIGSEIEEFVSGPVEISVQDNNQPGTSLNDSRFPNSNTVPMSIGDPISALGQSQTDVPTTQSATSVLVDEATVGEPEIFGDSPGRTAMFGDSSSLGDSTEQGDPSAIHGSLLNGNSATLGDGALSANSTSLGDSSEIPATFGNSSSLGDMAEEHGFSGIRTSSAYGDSPTTFGDSATLGDSAVFGDATRVESDPGSDTDVPRPAPFKPFPGQELKWSIGKPASAYQVSDQ